MAGRSKENPAENPAGPGGKKPLSGAAKRKRRAEIAAARERGEAPDEGAQGGPAGALPAHLEPGNPGNSGGKPGKSGRKPGWFKEFCQELLADERTRHAARQKLAMPFDAGWATAFKAIARFAEQDGELAIAEVRERVKQTARVLERELPRELYERVQPQLRAIWNGEAESEVHELEDAAA